jgi:hypothetical protein
VEQRLELGRFDLACLEVEPDDAELAATVAAGLSQVRRLRVRLAALTAALAAHQERHPWAYHGPLGEALVRRTREEQRQLLEEERRGGEMRLEGEAA